jgi:succinate dehydrogenase/fumarate reductase cytochrome b subunit
MRKISPHVQIYKFPITAISSIATRITGVGLTGMFIGAGTICLFNKDKEVIEQYTLLTPTVYHTLGGLRHFVWDKYPNIFLNNKAVARSSILLLGLTVPFTFLSEKLIKY